MDDRPEDGGEPVPVFESGAIMVDLTERMGGFLLRDLRGGKTVLEWLFWQVGGRARADGRQKHHFVQYAPEKLPYPMERCADMASYPWVVSWKQQQQQQQDPDAFPDLKRRSEAVHDYPGTQRACAKGEPCMNRSTVTENGKKLPFGPTAANVQPGGKP
jgi:GSH-dependent disulfide-bond oxidoreductase